MTPRVLTRLFNRIWIDEVKPDEWELAIITKIPKKGDLSECNNYRGKSLTSVIIKVFSLLILRVQSAVGTTLREEQAGFRR